MDHTAIIYRYRWSRLPLTSTAPKDGRSQECVYKHYTAKQYIFTVLRSRKSLLWWCGWRLSRFASLRLLLRFLPALLWPVSINHECLSLAKIWRGFHYQRSCKQNGYNAEKHCEVGRNRLREIRRWPIPVASGGQVERSSNLKFKIGLHLQITVLRDQHFG